MTEERGHRQAHKNFADSGYVHYVDSGGGFTTLYLCQILVSCVLFIQLVCVDYTPINLLEKKYKFLQHLPIMSKSLFRICYTRPQAPKRHALSVSFLCSPGLTYERSLHKSSLKYDE